MSLAPVAARWIVLAGLAAGEIVVEQTTPARASDHPLWHAMRPPARAGAGLVLDTRRRRLLLLGGDACAGPRGPEVWEMSLDTLWQARRVATRGLEPDPLIPAAAAYDSSADRVLVVGGTGNNQVWQLALGQTPATWTRVPTLGMPAPPRDGAAMAFDARRLRFIVVGGRSLGDPMGASLGDSWTVSIGSEAVWTEFSSAGVTPARSWRATLSYDPNHDRALLFGEGSGGLWSLDLSRAASWSRVEASGTSPPGWQSGIAWYDATRDRLLARGGFDPAGGRDATTWVFEFQGPLRGEWAALQAQGTSPTLAVSSSEVYDVSGDRWIVYGGFAWRGSSCVALGSLNALSLATDSWEDLLPGISTTIEIVGIRAFHDVRRDRVVLLPGTALREDGDAPHVLWAPLEDPLRWTASSVPSGCGTRYGELAVLDSLDDRVLVFGGLGFDGALADASVWSYSLEDDSWHALETSGSSPSARVSPAGAIDPFHRRLLMFGGFTALAGGAPSDELWSLDLDAATWQRESVSAGPSPRAESMLLIDRPRRRALLFNGSSGSHGFGEVWALDLDSLRWTRLGDQPFRLTEGLLLETPEGDALYSVGSDHGYSVLRGDPSHLVWTDLQAVGGPPVGRADGATGIYDSARHRIIAFDGSGSVPEPWVVDLEGHGVLSLDHLATRIDTLGRRATISWRSWDFAVINAQLERRIDHGDWDDLGLIQAYSGGTFTHVELELRDGVRYEFRLRIDDSGVSTVTGVTSFALPALPRPTVQVFPNPTSGDVSIRYELPAGTDGDRIDVYDILGRKIVERSAVGIAGSGSIALDRATLHRPGLYFVRISRGTRVLVSAPVVVLR